MRHALLLPLLATLAGCQLLGLAGDADLALSTDRTAYAFDGDLELRLYNGTDDSVGYNLCTAGLERRAGGAWEAVLSERVCTMELRGAAPGTRATATFDVAGYFEGVTFRPGTYRLATDVWVGDVRRQLRTAPFTITE